MQVQAYGSDRESAAAVADMVASAIAGRPAIVLGLPAGRTPILLYREIVAASQARGLDWSRVRAFSVDEFAGTSRATDVLQPFQRYMQEHLFAFVNIRPEHIDAPNGRAADLKAECARYEHAIAAAGGLDLLLLGIGANGHIGFNEPARSLSAGTHRAVLDERTRAANAYCFGGRIDLVPGEALSMGMATILRARQIVLVATGAEKADAVASMITGGITTAVPASFLQLHPDVTVVLDRLAARG